MGFSSCQVDITEKGQALKMHLQLNITNREEQLREFLGFLTYWFIG